MYVLDYIIWNPNPDIFTIPGIDWPLRWYGVTWLLGFLLSQQIMFHFFRMDNKPVEDVESLTHIYFYFKHYRGEIRAFPVL